MLRHRLVALLVLACCPAPTVAAQRYKDLHNFDNVHGASPSYAGILAQGQDGNLYGTTEAGGSDSCSLGCGVVFEISPGGVFSVLHYFHRFGVAGELPFSGLTLGEDGSFYGTTAGGTSYFCGTLFKVKPGALTALHDFTDGQDGCGSQAPPIKAWDRNFYGTAGENSYKMTPSGALTPLGQLPGNSPAPLVQASDGNFYGTTFYCGDGAPRSTPPNPSQPPTNCEQGTVFRLTPQGSVTIVHGFDGADGQGPTDPLIQATDGSLYGTTTTGGTYGQGVVFKTTTTGAFTIVHQFGDRSNDGGAASAGLLQASDGNLYGVTLAGGASGNGVIFRVTPAGDYSILYSFDGTKGAGPLTTPMQHTNGKIYGLATAGGTSNYGVVYSFDMGLRPFVKFVVPAGPVGANGGVLGQGLTGTTGVSFNGIPASFTVVSDTYLTTAVPQGATTGYVTVTTPTGVLTSNVPFQVIQ